MRIIIVIAHPYSVRDHHRFGAEYLMGCGYNVEIWRIIHESSVNMDWGGGMYHGSNYYEYSLVDFKKKLRTGREGCIFIFQGKTDEMYMAARLKCKCIVMEGLGAVPLFNDCDFAKESVAEKKGFAERLRGKTLKDYLIFVSCYQKALIEETKRKAKEFAWRNNPPILVVTSTHYACSLYFEPWEIETSHALYAHAMDYDRYIEANQTESAENGLIVYIDGGFSSRTYDFLLLSPDEFREYGGELPDRSSLEQLFDKLEEKYKQEVVVAGHPHKEYQCDTFCGRKLVFNRTCELVKNSSLVVLTTSTAMNFVALYNKPVLKIASSPFKSFEHAECYSAYEWIKLEAEEIMGCGFLDLDDTDAISHPWDYIKQMDNKKREEYIAKYIIDSNKSDKTIIEYMEQFIRNVMEKTIEQ